MAKPKAVRVPSDDCMVSVGGVEYALHAGEWIDVVPGLTVEEYKIQMAMLRLQVDIANADKPEEQSVYLGRAEESIDRTMAILGRRILGWNWTGDDEAPYPSPPTEEALRNLRMEEMAYLLSVLTGQNPDAKKNGTKP